jgi:hypothetical protein
MYYGVRYCDPVFERFIAPERIVPGAGALTAAPHDAVAQLAWAQGGGTPTTTTSPELNRYAYAQSTPLRCTDPTGHCVEPLTLTFCAVTATAFVLAAGSLIAVQASGTAAHGGPVAVPPSLAEQAARDLAPWWMRAAIAGGPLFGDVLRHAVADQTADAPAAAPSAAPQPPDAVHDLLSRTKPYRGRDTDRDYTGPDSAEEEFERIAEPGSVRNNPKVPGGKIGAVPGVARLVCAQSRAGPEHPRSICTTFPDCQRRSR